MHPLGLLLKLILVGSLYVGFLHILGRWHGSDTELAWLGILVLAVTTRHIWYHMTHNCPGPF